MSDPITHESESLSYSACITSSERRQQPLAMCQLYGLKDSGPQILHAVSFSVIGTLYWSSIE